MVSISIVAIFVLNLSHDDGTHSGWVIALTAEELKMLDPGQQLIEVYLCSLLIRGIGAGETENYYDWSKSCQLSDFLFYTCGSTWDDHEEARMADLQTPILHRCKDPV